jgi:hypothetical protein
VPAKSLQEIFIMKSALRLLVPLCLAGSAQAATLDFGTGPSAPSLCSNSLDGSAPLAGCTVVNYISQSYGDVAGAVDVSYSNNDPAVVNRSLRWWDTNYNNLYGVLWADGGDNQSFARIEIKALVPGDTVSLTGLDLGAWSNNTLGTTLRIYAIGGGPALFSYAGLVGNGSTAATHFAPNVAAVGGLWIEWQLSAYNVGIDNIDYSVGAVPEPATALSLLAGLAGLGALRRRRLAA